MIIKVLTPASFAARRAATPVGVRFEEGMGTFANSVEHGACHDTRERKPANRVVRERRKAASSVTLSPSGNVGDVPR
jgi:hypothetical protein